MKNCLCWVFFLLKYHFYICQKCLFVIVVITPEAYSKVIGLIMFHIFNNVK